MNILTSFIPSAASNLSSYKVEPRSSFGYTGNTLAADIWQPSSAKPLRFGRNYTAEPMTLQTIQQVLSGGNTTQWSPSYQAGPKVMDAVVSVLTDKTAVVPEAAIQEMTQALALTRNTRALVQGKPIQPQGAFEAEARQFFQDVSAEGGALVDTLQSLQLPVEATDLVKRWIAKTAPTLQLMGFSDAIPHASQVARLASVRSAQRNEAPVNTLASALVGWIHDPKLPDVFENLATHPMVASSIIEQAFSTDATLSAKLDAALKVVGGPTGPTASQLVNAITDAAGVNNDSAWVNQNVIFNRMTQKGVSTEQLKETFWQRFSSLSAEAIPEDLSAPQLAELQKATFDTGLYSFNRASFGQVMNAMGQTTGLEALLVTDKPQEDVLLDLGQRLKSANAVESVQVPALGLLNNSEALASPLAKSVARNLAEADNSLLSPHKIVLTSKAGNVVARVASFLTSFQDNVNALPTTFRSRASEWQVDVTHSIVQAMESLTQRPLYQAIWNTAPVAEKLQKMTEVILDPSAWVKSGADTVNYGQADENTAPPVEVAVQRQQVQDVAKALQVAYNHRLASSPVMFQFKKP